jgi:hypothetical protein
LGGGGGCRLPGFRWSCPRTRAGLAAGGREVIDVLLHCFAPCGIRSVSAKPPNANRLRSSHPYSVNDVMLFRDGRHSVGGNAEKHRSAARRARTAQRGGVRVAETGGSVGGASSRASRHQRRGGPVARRPADPSLLCGRRGRSPSLGRGAASRCGAVARSGSHRPGRAARVCDRKIVLPSRGRGPLSGRAV